MPDDCPHDDLVGYWQVQISADVSTDRHRVYAPPFTRRAAIDTEMSDIYGQVDESEPVEVACRECGAILWTAASKET